MTSISASQLQCVFGQLSSSSASTYASKLSSHLGGSATLTNKCHWAAFLGNVGTESAGLTAWEEYGCYSTYPDGYCGRGPLQITGYNNYKYCAGAGDCSGCSGIVGTPSIASTNTDVGMETSRCVWHSLSGRSLSTHSDGSLAGFLAASICINMAVAVAARQMVGQIDKITGTKQIRVWEFPHQPTQLILQHWSAPFFFFVATAC